jgi:hypothetical protein
MAAALHGLAPMADEIPAGLTAYIAQRFGATVERAEVLVPDAGGRTTAKLEGYGVPVRLYLKGYEGRRWQCVFHTARANAFGHDRRSDRAQQQLLAWDTFPLVEGQAAALDVGGIRLDGSLTTLSDVGELFLVTEWAQGAPYADDLRRLARGGPLEVRDVERVKALAGYLGRLHERLEPDRVKWERCLRDTVGSGEGLFGIADAYGSEHARELLTLEQLATARRWALKPRVHRLSRTHGDFHPFNLVFRDGTDFTALDASRGAAGEPADDVTALGVNFVFFAIEHRERWRGVFSTLWDTLWTTYLMNDPELLDAAGLFLAWRLAVVACPRFYPHLSERSRTALLEFAKRAVTEPRFDPQWAHGLFS